MSEDPIIDPSMHEPLVQPNSEDFVQNEMRDFTLEDDAKLLLQGESIQAAKRLWQSQEETREAEHRATHDELTGLLNRSGLEQKMSSFFEGAETGDVGVVFADLDEFKQINDRMSHQRGDAFLQIFSGWLSEFVRHENGGVGDIVARVGGDEFVIAVKLNTVRREGEEQMEPTAKLDAFSKRLSDGFNEFLGRHPGYKRVGVGLSVGGAIWEDGMDISELIGFADAEMYQTKRRKRKNTER